jgi:DedD protein
MANRSRHGSERVLGSGHLIGIFLGVVVLCCVFFTLGYVMGHSQDPLGRLSSMADSDSGGTPSDEAVPAERTSSSRPATAGSDAAQSANGPGEWNFSGSEKNGVPRDAAGTAVTPGSVQSSPVSTPALSPSAEEPTASSAGQPAAARPEGSGTSEPTSPKPHAMPAPLSSVTASPLPPPNGAVVKTTPQFATPIIPKGALVLQVAALQSESDALAMMSVLQKKSFPAFVVRPGTDNLYRVQVGPYRTKAEAIQARKSLEQVGFQPIFKH